MLDREEDGHNGARLYPERILRGLSHPSSVFKSAEEIQRIRATFNAAPDTFGIIKALALYFKCGRGAIEKAIRGFKEIPDDNSLAIDVSRLDICNRVGNANSRATMPKDAMELFYWLFNGCCSKGDRECLLRFVTKKYNVSKGYLISIGKGKLRPEVAKNVERKAMPKRQGDMNNGTLEIYFEPFPRLR